MISTHAFEGRATVVDSLPSSSRTRMRTSVMVVLQSDKVDPLSGQTVGYLDDAALDE